MKIKRIKTNGGWKVCLEYKGKQYLAVHKSMRKAMAIAFKLAEPDVINTLDK